MIKLSFSVKTKWIKESIGYDVRHTAVNNTKTYTVLVGNKGTRHENCETRQRRKHDSFKITNKKNFKQTVLNEPERQPAKNKEQAQD